MSKDGKDVIWMKISVILTHTSAQELARVWLFSVVEILSELPTKESRCLLFMHKYGNKCQANVNVRLCSDVQQALKVRAERRPNTTIGASCRIIGALSRFSLGSIRLFRSMHHRGRFSCYSHFDGYNSWEKEASGKRCYNKVILRYFTASSNT